MAQRHVEVIIGRLLTDEEFRQRFTSEPDRVLDQLAESGVELTHDERLALMATGGAQWARLARAIDPRLQKASLKGK
ncbi:MAG TPA: Os1348 family NHLP clan protein [Vicinamibacterales bacterium]